MSSSNTTEVPYWDETGVDEQKFKDWITTGTWINEIPKDKTSTEKKPWEIFIPRPEHCGIWKSSPNKERHASFGDQGTTASITCYGDLSQITQFLGAGHSGMFTIDQSSTSEPCYVADRARNLDYLSTDRGSELSFGLSVPSKLCPAESSPPEVEWVHWRWPRYRYDTGYDGVEACFQYMVHKGVVLQQFTVVNNSNTPVTIDGFQFDSELCIRDLDFLDNDYPFNYMTYGVSESAGPFGYGFAHVHPLSEGDGYDEESVVPPANQSTECVGPRATPTMQEQLQKDKSGGAQGTSAASQPHSVASEYGWFGDRKLRGKNDSQGNNTLEIVIAYKLVLLQEPKSDWRKFVIPAKDANINHWLRKEREELWEGDDNTTLLAAGLSLISIPETKAETAKDGKQDAASATGKGFEESLDKDAKPDPFTGAPNGLLTGQDQDQTESTLQNPKYHLEYFAWRHLEHILSVCAIPTTTPGLIQERGHSSSGSSREFEAIALTCGDMSGHRINTPASYFAFQFLADAARRLERCQTKTRYMLLLEKRIKATCSGHIRWLQLLRKTNLLKSPKELEPRDRETGKEHFSQTECFAANYWVTGEIMPENSDNWLPPNSMTDTALNILKIAEYIDFYSQGDPKDACMADQMIDGIYIPWLVELDKLDRRKAFAWPHSRVEGINTFRLDDHFWIWKALSFLDKRAKKVQPKLRLRNENARIVEEKRIGKDHPWLKRLYPDENMIEAAKEFTSVAKRLAPSNVQRGILQRFTTENDVSKRRMLAVTRSARETRFLLHARDTALFYAEDCNFFPAGSFSQLWADVIETQRYHEENREAVWDKALRYALGIVMGTRGHTLNNDTAADLVKRCVSILIGAGGHDAFFPGELEEGGREPTTIFSGEDSRDFFYHSSFETNYILLSHARKIDEIFRGVDCTQTGNSAKANSAISSSDTDGRNRRFIQSMLAGMFDGLSEQEYNSIMRAMEPNPLVFKKPRRLLMKKLLPFTNVIYSSNVKSIEEEWLYNYPDFLSGSVIDTEVLKSRLESAESNSESTGTIIGNKISDSGTGLALLYSKKGCSLSFHVADYKKQKGLGRRQKKQLDPDTMVQVYSNLELFKRLGRCRTAVSAKKRFIWLPNADIGTAIACWGASPERTSHKISLFFDRHARYEKTMWDDTSMMFNEWQTEVHFSFYVLVDEEHAGISTDMLVNVDKPFPRRPGKLGPGKIRTEKRLQRASISFRFDGDFFDRYWTCHFIEHVPGEKNKEAKKWDFDPFQPQREDEQPSPGKSRNKIEQKPWWQRKVLEIYLFNRTLREIDRASSSVLDEVRTNLGISKHSPSPTTLDSKRDLLSMDYWQRLENILQSIEEDLTSALFEVQKWNSREKDRGEENPRWTRTDEKKYRTTIKKLTNTTRDTNYILNDRRDHIRSLKEILAASQTRLRDDLEFHQNENVRYFTYATVIFLPLGFAASFYSMSGAPSQATIVSLVVFAIAAFAVTVAVLLSSRIVFKAFTNDVGPRISQAAKALQTKGLTGVINSLLKLSARRVVRAVLVLKQKEHPPQKVLDVLLGVLSTLIMGPSWLVKLLLVNTLDLLQACGIEVQTMQSKLIILQEEPGPSSSGEEHRDEEHNDKEPRNEEPRNEEHGIHKIMESSETIRPFKDKHWIERKRQGQPKTD